MAIYAIDWSHKDEKFAVHDGKKASLKMPENLTSEDIIVTENIPEKYIRKAIETGVKVLKCSTNLTAKIRKEHKLEKSDPLDAKILWLSYKKYPEEFTTYYLRHPLAGYYEKFKDVQKLRIATSNRSWDDGVDSEYLKDLDQLEKKQLKIIEKQLKKEPIYIDFLQKVKGVGPAIACGLIANIGQIKRFDSFPKMMSYFGLAVDKDNKAPKLKKGQIANWNQKARALILGVVADQFVKQKTPKYREIYDVEKKKQLEVLKGEKTCKGHAERRARRKAAKYFMKDLWKEYRRIEKLPIN